ALSNGENSNNGLENYCVTCTATFDPAPGADVNLYTGSMSVAVPLLSLNGRNGLDLDLSLMYNSQTDLYVGNELWSGGQASWAGTGCMALTPP
ncbi:MAG: hypothetical protein V1743_03265, partial [Nanoarchaeota archaeon]